MRILTALADRFMQMLGYRVAYDGDNLTHHLSQQPGDRAVLDRHIRQAVRKNTDELSVQPGLLDVRRDALDDALFLEGTAEGARRRGLNPALVDAIDRATSAAHDYAAAIADAARATTPAHR